MKLNRLSDAVIHSWHLIPCTKPRPRRSARPVNTIDNAALALTYRRRHMAHLDHDAAARFVGQFAALLSLGVLLFVLTVIFFCS